VATVCHVYGWPFEYVMAMPYERVVMFYRRGVELLTGDDPMPNQTPDRDRFHDMYGERIKKG
jgi:hypothetical protein